MDFGHGNLIDANLDSLPRVVTSRSQDKQNTDSRLMSKRDVKIATVEMAISAFDGSWLIEGNRSRHK